MNEVAGVIAMAIFIVWTVVAVAGGFIAGRLWVRLANSAAPGFARIVPHPPVSTGNTGKVITMTEEHEREVEDRLGEVTDERG